MSLYWIAGERTTSPLWATVYGRYRLTVREWIAGSFNWYLDGPGGTPLAQGHAATLAEAQAAAEDALREVVEGNHE